jgi:type II secretory pathway component PulF
MQTFDYKLVTDRYTAEGQIDADDEKKAESLLRSQTAHPIGTPPGLETKIDPPTVQSIKLTPKKSA